MSDKYILSIDTATPVQSLALLRGDDILFESFAKSQNKEGPGLLSLVDDALRHCELKIADIDRFVVSRGPGAFTGLRVSMAMLKSLALTLNKPLYAASSLDAIAQDALPGAGVTASCIDARRGEIYTAFYIYREGAVQKLSDELLLKPDDFVQYIQNAFPGQAVTCVGPAFPNYTAKLSALCDKLVIRRANPRAALLAQIVQAQYGDAQPDVTLEALEPKYIRMDDFEVPKPFDITMPQYRHEN